jgi:hypothetical protein
LQNHPVTVRAGGVPWTIDLRKRVYDLPYSLRLNKFTKEEHPGTLSPRKFASDVTMMDGAVQQPFHISMNEPMRHHGFMFSQNAWGPPDGQPPFYSILEVSSNPTDQWPKWSCLVIFIGMLLHFVIKLVKYVLKQNRSLATP